MAHPVKISGVPNDKVDRIIAGWKADGATDASIKKTKENGTWTLEAMLPDEV